MNIIKIIILKKFQNCKSECECGLMVDKFRFARHRKTKKHLKNLSEKNLNIELNKILE